MIAGRLLDAARHRLLSALLGTHDLRVGRGSIFRGSKHLRIGKSFHAHGSVWIEAVCTYGDQRFEPMISIGDNVSASNDLHISCIRSVSIGSGVLFGSRVYVSDHNHGDYRNAGQSSPSIAPADRLLGGGGPVRIEDNVWIGHNVVIVGPSTIGRGAIVGAGSVVRGDIRPGTMVGGVPAVTLKRYDAESGSWRRAL